MATNQPSPAELKEALSLLKQLKKGYAELGGVNPFANFNADNIQDIITQAGGVENILTDWTLQLDKVEDNLEGVGKSAKSVYQQFNNIVGELKKTNQNITLGNKSMNAFQKTAEKLKDDQQGITRLSKTELETLQKQNKQAISNLDIANIALQQQIDRNELEGDELTKAQALIDERKAEATAIKDLINLTDNRLEKEKEIEKTLGIAPKLLEGLKKIPIIGDVLDIKGAQTAMIEAAEGGASGFQAMGAGIKALGPSLKAALGPLALISLAVGAIQGLINMMFEADEQVTNMAKSFNTTKEDARDIRKSFFELSDEANNFGKIQKGNLILQKDLVSANLQLNELLGTSVDLSSSLGNNGKELAVQFADASKFLKLGADEQKGLLELTASTGKSIDNIKNSVLGTTRLRKLESGVLLDERKILKDVLTASNAIKLSVKGGAEGLTKAAFAAAELGSDLSKVEAISKSLLNFEDSISAEMEAELLTGRNLNLETARRAALNGDIETVAKEINKQVGTSADFTKMNVIQQEALAKAMGTSREELADMLVQQESLNSLKGTFNALGKETIENLKKNKNIDEATYKNLISGKAAATDYFDALQKSGMKQEEIVKLLGEEATASLESQTAQEKFNDVLEKAKETFARFIDGGYLDKLANTLAGIADRGILQSLTSSKEETSGYERLKSKGYKVEEGSGLFGTGAFKKTKIFDKEGKEIDSVIGSRGLEGLADMYAPKAKTESADDFIIRPGQPMVKLNKDDLVIGGTNLGGGGNEEVTALLKELVTAVKSGGNIYLDGTKVGTAMNVSTYKVQ
jgi:hypothetical protein